MTDKQDLELEQANDPEAVPRRVALVSRHDSLKVETEPEEMSMTIPHLVLREVIAMEILVAVLAAYSLLVDAPLEELANSLKTPNPAKAPWYFLGLQELLHYFPPIVAGVLVPVLVICALIVIPYFDINVHRNRLWGRRDWSVLIVFGVCVAVLLGFLIAFGVWPAIVPTLVLSGMMAATFLYPCEGGAWGWFCELSLPSWVMIWFVVCATTLTLIGTFFRGPGWSFVWPWQ